MSMMAHNWLYDVLIVAEIVLMETGLVIMPFLPGDSLLFATGAFLGVSNIPSVSAIFILVLAAVLGDGTNYLIGRSAIGQQLIRPGWVKLHHLDKTRAYFDHFGPMTVTVDRFVPMVRTVASFLAGLTGMALRRFALFDVLGAVLWCSGMLSAGYWLGGIPWVREHMSWLSLGIIVISLLPVLLQLKRTIKSGGG